MKKIRMLIGVFLCLLLLPGFQNQDDAEQEEILSLIVPCPVIAVVRQTAAKYQTYDETAGRIGVFEPGTKVEILQDRSAQWYRVRKLGEEDTAWVMRASLYIPADDPPSRDLLTKTQLEQYMNLKGFESETAYFILTDIYRQLTYIFSGEKENWSLIKTITCSTGKNESPTTRGLFKIGERGEWFYSERLGSGSMYWMRFNGSYLFHSVAMDQNRKIIDNVIGDRRSMGCIRLELADAKWLYLTIPEKTSVFVT
ncbi:MAG: L,D-transpeptidase family protein [Clostridiales bacterium]|nr:L,D-transpeptidase family protein [Clostridiales bacterium]